MKTSHKCSQQLKMLWRSKVKVQVLFKTMQTSKFRYILYFQSCRRQTFWKVLLTFLWNVTYIIFIRMSGFSDFSHMRFVSTFCLLETVHVGSNKTTFWEDQIVSGKLSEITYDQFLNALLLKYMWRSIGEGVLYKMWRNWTFVVNVVL